MPGSRVSGSPGKVAWESRGDRGKQTRKEHLEVADGMDNNVKSSGHGTPSSEMATRFKGHTARAGRWTWAMKDGCKARWWTKRQQGIGHICR